MDSLLHLLWNDGRFLGIEWHFWKVIGWLGNATFFSRFLVQWYATERQRRVVVPVAFWWLSLLGALLLFSYALFYRRDSVFIFAYAFTWIPYVRNLIIHRRSQAAMLRCATCSSAISEPACFCSHCGAALGSQARSGGSDPSREPGLPEDPPDRNTEPDR
ncbi:MAG: lipid-A-disaccharide synthase N-terminal domain-containing protein [Verrucomicrobiales bacterium]|nr:lipid-A-disaccharide synthase N-terminal domain-containing protein [Verrucomicrobiales bacterium]